MVDTPTPTPTSASPNPGGNGVTPGRASMRAKIFAGKDVKKQQIEFFGVTLELRQPKLGDILSAQDNEDRQAAVIETLIKYAFIPGTDEHIFEEADADAFKEMPFGKDFHAVSKALQDLTEINFLDTAPKSKSAQPSS